MGEAFLVRRGLAAAFAVIGVTFPAGSVCTCSKGEKIFRARNTSGSFLFFVPEAGTWTVAVTNGARTASKSVVIDSQYHSENVILNYDMYLYRDGVYASGVTPLAFTQSGTLTDTETEIKLSYTRKCYRYFALDISAYNAADVVFRNTNGYYNYLRVFASPNNDGDYSVGAMAVKRVENNKPGEYTVTLDISSLQGLNYVYAGGDSNGESWEYNRTLYIKSIYLH